MRNMRVMWYGIAVVGPCPHTNWDELAYELVAAAAY